jgi:putative ABC transport system permease protein
MKIMKKTLQEYEAAIAVKLSFLSQGWIKMKLEAKGGGLEKADKKNIYTLLGLSIVIVLLSAINFINLKTAQASQRAKEVGVRRVMGGTTWQLTSQFLLRHYLYVCLLICWQRLLLKYYYQLIINFWVKKLHYLMLVFLFTHLACFLLQL